ncbi:MAG: hypothetical protein ABI397_00900 [Candidatus Saccharimonas sp.]
MATKAENLIIKRVHMHLAIISAVILLAFGCIAFWAHDFVGSMVQSQLSAQKIYFPEAGSPSFSPEAYPSLQKYAGQIVDTPEKAKAFANDYIGNHLKHVADGKVYSEVSAEAQKDPTNPVLKAQQQTLFQGETLRGMLLTSGYGFGTIGEIAGIVTYITFGGGIVMAVVAIALSKRR